MANTLQTNIIIFVLVHVLVGPFWTDYSVLEETEASMNVTHPITSFVQIVGHTIHLNKIKTTRLLGAVGIDAGKESLSYLTLWCCY